jgi:hypothetical protein
MKLSRAILRCLLFAQRAFFLLHDDHFRLHVVLSFFVAYLLGYVFRPDP